MRYLLLAPLFSWATISAFADDAAISVPVRILGAVQPAPPMDPMIPDREPAPAATPAARMPQYQLHHKDLGEPGDPNSPPLRFVLAMPEQPLLIEASILIDGQPFRQARERRVQEIMRYIADPEPFRAEAARIAAESARMAAEAQAEAEAEAELKNPPSLVQAINALITGGTPADAAAAPTPEPTPDAKDATSKDAVKSDDVPPEATETPATETPAAEAVAVETPVTEPAAVEAPVEPAVAAVPKYAVPATIYERIDRYTQSVGAPPSVDEVRWLLTNWVDGPQVLFLNDNFQRFRAAQQPVYKVLDRDRDGIVSVEKLTQSVASFRECDLNREGAICPVRRKRRDSEFCFDAVAGVEDLNS